MLTFLNTMYSVLYVRFKFVLYLNNYVTLKIHQKKMGAEVKVRCPLNTFTLYKQREHTTYIIMPGELVNIFTLHTT